MRLTARVVAVFGTFAAMSYVCVRALHLGVFVGVPVAAAVGAAVHLAMERISFRALRGRGAGHGKPDRAADH
jgi:branched-subunit amino acid ABC-type transport system permease component